MRKYIPFYFVLLCLSSCFKQSDKPTSNIYGTRCRIPRDQDGKPVKATFGYAPTLQSIMESEKDPSCKLINNDTYKQQCISRNDRIESIGMAAFSIYATWYDKICQAEAQGMDPAIFGPDPTPKLEAWMREQLVNLPTASEIAGSYRGPIATQKAPQKGPCF